MSRELPGELSGGRMERGRLRLPPVLVRFWIGIAGLFALSVLYTFVMTHVFHKPHPYGGPYFGDEHFYSDYMLFVERFRHFRTPSFWDAFNYPFTYPAPVAVVFGLYSKLPYPMQMYQATCVAALLAGGWFLVRAFVRRGIGAGVAIAFTLTALITSFPIVFLLNRANIEGIVAIFAGAGVLAALDRRWGLAAVLIGIAGAMKLFPLVLLGLLLSKRRYKEFALALLVAAAVTLASLRYIGPTVGEAQRQISAGLEFFKYHWAVTWMRTAEGYDHSLFTLPKIVLGYLTWSRPNRDAWMSAGLTIYFWAVAVFGVLAYFLRIRKLPMLNQVFALLICAVLLPPVSFDYTLVHLLLPSGLLCVYAVDRWRLRDPAKDLNLHFACLALISTAGAYFTIKYRMAGQVRALALTVLLVILLRRPLPWPPLDSDGAGPVLPVETVPQG